MNKPLALVIVIALALSLPNLGDRHLWGDEIHLVNLAKSILKNGLPIVDTDLKAIEPTYEKDSITGIEWKEYKSYGIPYGNATLYTLHPWAVSYIVAIPMSIFGPHAEFWIRLPFVLIGIIGIIITYYLAKNITGNEKTSLIASLLLALSPVYLLALRNANYYGLIIFSLPATVYTYMKILEGKKASWQFALSAALLFHSQWLLFFATMLGITTHFILFTNRPIKKIILPLLLTFILTFPWFYITGQLGKSDFLPSITSYALLFSVGVYHFIQWFIPLPFVFLALWICRTNKKLTLPICVIIAHFIFLPLNYYTGTPIRYYYGLLPLAMIFNGILFEKLWNKKTLAITLLILFVFTNLLSVSLLIPFKPILTKLVTSQNILDTGENAQLSFLQKSLKTRIPLIEYLYEITHHVQSPTREIIEIIETNPRSGKIFYTVGDGSAIGYYTGLQPFTFPNNFNTKYEWITLTKKDPRNEQLSSYTRTEMNLTLDKWGDTADPYHHLFKTTSGEGFFIYQHN